MKDFRGLRATRGLPVHRSVSGDSIAAARHSSFLAVQLGGSLALTAFPLYLATLGAPTPLTLLAAVWALAPLAIAAFVVRTGALPAAHLIAAANLAALAAVAAGLTGGLNSYLSVWIAIVPLAAAASGDRSAVLAAIAMAGLAILGLALAGASGLLPPAPGFAAAPILPATIAFGSAAAYAGGLALAIQAAQARLARAARAEADHRRLLAENSTDIVTRHTERGEVVFVSHAAERILGAEPGRLAGSGLQERVHLADRPAYLTALTRCAARSHPVTAQFRLRRGAESAAGQGADYIWVEMRCRPAPDSESGAPAGEIVAVTRDITEHRCREAELQSACERAESASRAKTQFLASMSHELRTPLNAIIGFSEILAQELFGRLGEQRYRDYSRLIHESGQHLLSVVNEILDLSKIEAGKFSIVPEPLEVAGLVASCCDILRNGADSKSIALVAEVPPGLPNLVADKRACRQMLLNLLSNAIKFTQDGGRVQVTVRRSQGSLRLAVADTGIGISKADLPRLGQPFVQADTSYNRGYNGAGLGLSVVKGLARLHGGDIEIDSELGRGTLVTIVLPLEAVIADTPEPASEDATPLEPRRLAMGA